MKERRRVSKRVSFPRDVKRLSGLFMRKRRFNSPELSQPSHVTIEPTRSMSEMHDSGQTPIRILVTKNGSQHNMNTPITIPT